MSKGVITILSIIAIVLFIVGIVLFTGTVINAAAACQNAADTQTCANANVGGAGIASLLFLLGIVATFIAWLLSLIKTIQIGRWGWFVAVLLFSPIASLIYGLAGPTERAM